MPTWKTNKNTSMQHEISFGETPSPSFVFFFFGGGWNSTVYIYIYICNMWYINVYIYILYIRGEHQLLGPGGDFNSTNKKPLKGGGEKRGRILTLIKSIGWGKCNGGTDARWKCFLWKRTQAFGRKQKNEQELKAEISWKKDVKASFNHLPSNLGVCVCVFCLSYCKNMWTV